MPAGLADGLGREGAPLVDLWTRTEVRAQIDPNLRFPRSIRPARLLEPASNRLGDSAGTTRLARQTPIQLLAPQGVSAGQPSSAVSR
jgi:hypothetical protein